MGRCSYGEKNYFAAFKIFIIITYITSQNDDHVPRTLLSGGTNSGAICCESKTDLYEPVVRYAFALTYAITALPPALLLSVEVRVPLCRLSAVFGTHRIFYMQWHTIQSKLLTGVDVHPSR